MPEQDTTSSDARQGEQLVLRVRPDGSLEGLHTPDLGLEELGHLEVQRASHVEFDERAQEWVARTAEDGEVICRHERRSVCLRAERRYFNNRLQDGYTPFRAD